MDSMHTADSRRLLDDRGYQGRLIRGQNPALVLEKAVRDRITESLYFKEQCFGLNEATLCDRAVDLTYIGGTYGGLGKPTPFLCLLFKILQLVPDKEVILAYLDWGAPEGEEGDEEDDKPPLTMDGNGGDEKPPRKGEFKYLRALAAFYIRLAWEPKEIYTTLEPLLADYRKLRRRTKDGYKLTYVDQFIDDLLTKDRVCATSLWKIPARTMLEDQDILEPRENLLGDRFDDMDAESERNGRSESPRSSSRSPSRNGADVDDSMSGG